jgi:hypothetical protein
MRVTMFQDDWWPQIDGEPVCTDDRWRRHREVGAISMPAVWFGYQNKYTRALNPFH